LLQRLKNNFALIDDDGDPFTCRPLRQRQAQTPPVMGLRSLELRSWRRLLNTTHRAAPQSPCR